MILLAPRTHPGPRCPDCTRLTTERRTRKAEATTLLRTTWGWGS